MALIKKNDRHIAVARYMPTCNVVAVLYSDL